ncbi:DUF262 domain-containing protein [Helicobacter saguini]|uniref:DUF262 domain-containing protein n=1 Tax=Helicobacter saguini TaxID=1548018 RepID=A0A347VR89_9HELI|nr:DUF262 domain-containing protein [Helicobacter saguini]MWV62991.1 DUF262 domain-containing protein [Helicobacter saguini]MWV66340.1 DUF262 domain-containing protein [Helicobacter saguini]MWV68692.1 DUF262 domain-containing protein [Helicobacter saguini]MWV71757.1 DUF262 domain-containing protein [Helicobacter saguini]TLD91548.1 DUF262 domain-containing protein [Helicobacter saguini]
MAEMKTERKNILDYLSKNKFLIPMYQRAYVWSEDECEQLYDDVYNFFDTKMQDSDEEYFLGSVVMYKEQGRQNIIDGQQRTTTLSLFIRALYRKAKNHGNSDKISKLLNSLASCLWDTDPLDGSVDFTKPHLKSEVAIDSDNNLLNDILSDKYNFDRENIDNIIKKSNSNYEKNYLYFVKKIDELAMERPDEWYKFCLSLLTSCIILPIECDGQDNALRIFNTINNRGISLNTADIFKGIIYANLDNASRNNFAKEWKNLESKISNSNYLAKEDISFLFTQLEHIIRAKHNEVDTVIPSTLDFFTKKDKLNSKKKKVHFAANEDALSKAETFKEIQSLAEFWCNPKEYMNENAQKYFDILSIYQNKMWQMVLSVIYFKHKPKKDCQENIFDSILPQIVSYCAIGLIYGKGGSSGLFWGFMKANINILNKKEKIFESGLNIPDLTMPSLEIFTSFCVKALPKHVRYILAIYTLIYDKNQSWEWNYKGKNYSVIKGEIEHILPKKWQNSNYNGWDKDDANKYLEYIGNKSLLEKKINIDCGNGYFLNKKKLYIESNFLEMHSLGKSDLSDWSKEQIENRNKEIYEKLKSYFANILV